MWHETLRYLSCIYAIVRGISRKELSQFATYYLIACLSSWLAWAPLVLGQDGLKLLPISPPGPVLISLGTLGPALACFVTHRLWAGDWRAVRLFPQGAVSWVWFLLGPLLVLLCFFVLLPLMATTASPRSWYQHVNALAGIPGVMFSYNLLAGPLFEEFGWRGFLQSRLQRLAPPWIAATCVGVVLAGWHLPLFLVEGWNSGSVLAYVFACVGLAIVMAIPFNASGQSVAVAILMHSAFNASPRFLGTYLENCPVRTSMSGESFVACVFMGVGIILTIITRGDLAASNTK